jgi:hypothetical protein
MLVFDDEQDKEFLEYLNKNNIKFDDNLPYIGFKQRYESEYCFKTSRPIKPWHEMPLYEKIIRLIGETV